MSTVPSMQPSRALRSRPERRDAGGAAGGVAVDRVVAAVSQSESRRLLIEREGPAAVHLSIARDSEKQVHVRAVGEDLVVQVSSGPAGHLSRAQFTSFSVESVAAFVRVCLS